MPSGRPVARSTTASPTDRACRRRAGSSDTADTPKLAKKRDHAGDDAVRQLTEQLAQPRLLIARLGKRHEHAGVLVPDDDGGDRARRRLQRCVAAKRRVHSGQLTLDRGAADRFQQVEPGRVVVGEMALPQAGARGDAGLGETRVAVLPQHGEASLDDVMPAILHDWTYGWLTYQ